MSHTEKELKAELVEVAKEYNDRGLADFAVDQMIEDARKEFRRDRMSKGED